MPPCRRQNLASCRVLADGHALPSHACSASTAVHPRAAISNSPVAIRARQQCQRRAPGARAGSGGWSHALAASCTRGHARIAGPVGEAAAEAAHGLGFCNCQ